MITTNLVLLPELEYIRQQQSSLLNKSLLLNDIRFEIIDARKITIYCFHPSLYSLSIALFRSPV